MSLEEDYAINCPYCGTGFSVRVDQTGGSHQAFVTDCENCCRPIEIEVRVYGEGDADVVAKREGEG